MSSVPPEAQREAQREAKPNPDPTSLTTEQSEKGLKALREVIEAKLDGVDRYLEVLSESISHRKEEIDKEVGHLGELVKEKFHGIETQFQERDTRTDKTAELNQKAIDAALQAAKEAVNAQNISSAQSIAKSEAATTKEIDALKTLITAVTKTAEDKIASIKELMAMSNGTNQGRVEAVDNSRANVAILVSIITTILSIAGVILAVFAR